MKQQQKTTWQSPQTKVRFYKSDQKRLSLWLHSRSHIKISFFSSILTHNPQHIRIELPYYISSWLIIANHQNFPLLSFCHSNTQFPWRLPHHLWKVTRFEHALRFDTEIELFHLVIPRSAYIFRICFSVSIGRPQAVDIFTVIGIWTVGESIFSGQGFSPVLWNWAEIFVESVSLGGWVISELGFHVVGLCNYFSSGAPCFFRYSLWYRRIAFTNLSKSPSSLDESVKSESIESSDIPLITILGVGVCDIIGRTFSAKLPIKLPGGS